MKIFALPAGENWVCDRFVEEWRKYAHGASTDDPHVADILWLLSGWCWKHVPMQLLHDKKVVATIHHIDPDKFDDSQYADFMARDQFVDMYHVPCGRTMRQVRMFTDKPIFIQPFWVNQMLWYPMDMTSSRVKRGLPTDKFLIGSFQRDTEGHDLMTPKLAKGPDVFADVVEVFNANRAYDVHVVLAGWRRQYVMKRLDDANIPYTYFDRPTFDVVNELYNALDLYVVGSRHEGGPQAVFECAATQTPIISTPVGYADVLLGPADGMHIFEISDEPGAYDKLPDRFKHLNTSANYDRVISHFLPQGMDPFLRMFGRMLA